MNKSTIAGKFTLNLLKFKIMTICYSYALVNVIVHKPSEMTIIVAFFQKYPTNILRRKKIDLNSEALPL